MVLIKSTFSISILETFLSTRRYNCRRFLSGVSSVKPTVLFLDPILSADSKLRELEKIANVEYLKAKTRVDFIEALKTQYQNRNIVAIYRSFGSFRSTGRIDGDLAKHFPSTLKAIAHNGAGYDQIEISAMTELGIQVSNIPEAVDNSTADTNIWLMIGALRNFSFGSQIIRERKWIDHVPVGNDPSSKVLGILGMGGIGRAVRDRSKALGFKKIIYHNRNKLSDKLADGAEYVNFEELLNTSDIININVPLTTQTKHIINTETISKMKTGVIIVNTARGAVIDEQALADGLASGKIKSVGLDVFEFEPKPHPDIISNRNILILPHMGTHSIETKKAMEELALKNIENFLTKKKLLTAVPEQRGLDL